VKPSIGRIVHWNEEDGTIRPALILACEMKPGAQAAEPRSTDPSHFDVTLEVHATAKFDGRLISATQIIERAPFSIARSGHESARGCWTWPPRDT